MNRYIVGPKEKNLEKVKVVKNMLRECAMNVMEKVTIELDQVQNTIS